MNKRIYYTALTLAITGICTAATAVAAADESITTTSPSPIDSYADQNLQGEILVASAPLSDAETTVTSYSKQPKHLEGPNIPPRVLASPDLQPLARLDIEKTPITNGVVEVSTSNIDFSATLTFKPSAQTIAEIQALESKTSHSFDNSASLLALASETVEPANAGIRSQVVETPEPVVQNINFPTAPTFTPSAQTIAEIQAPELKTSHSFDSSASLLALASEIVEETNTESEVLKDEKTEAVVSDINLPIVPTSSAMAQAIPEFQAPAVEADQSVEHGAALLRPLAPGLTAEPKLENSATIQRNSVADAVVAPAPKQTPTLQSNLDRAPITPKSSEILDNYGLVNSIKGNKVSVRLLNGKNKTYLLASNSAGSQIRRGGLMGFNTDRRGRITRLAPPKIKKIYQGTLVIVEGTKIGMVTPEGERFITTLSKRKIAHMGLAPGQPIKITQYSGTWATKVCRPGVLSDRQISSDAMQRQRNFLRGETSPKS
ncbi:hypothetical protein C1752_04104 [Acaryochloris thomasi RCC1774]|uniref:Uncharacterized protein n=1 Tax=Acaryochloris thomasi RCC1774 TaxID=1764569 RepID=A0A2W1JEB4_9CYAN|nr:hypothetical protein [Acaryochloris thomasi]PZD72028.1 hypothetical protein C1752_04104 [Acaryochloris thomasi RCC1774]